MQSERVALPPNTIYKKTFQIPVLGTQSVAVRVLTPVRAAVSMKGVITVSEVVKYSIDTHGHISLGFSQNTMSLFKRYGTKFGEACLSEDKQTVSLFMRPPLYTHDVEILLIRHNSPTKRAKPKLAATAADVNGSAPNATRRPNACLIC